MARVHAFVGLGSILVVGLLLAGCSADSSGTGGAGTGAQGAVGNAGGTGAQGGVGNHGGTGAQGGVGNSGGSGAEGGVGNSGGAGGQGGSCADSYTIGGTVGGLLGTGLVLQNGGADDLAVAQNGAFTFATALAPGQSYAVTVLTPPTAPTQTCDVLNGTGTVGCAPVTTVSVQCSLTDSDGDDIPDLADPFPNDPNTPGVAQPNTVYPQTSSQLFTMDVNNFAINLVGTFHGSGFSGSVTDVAVDQYGVLYAVTFTDLYTCNPNTAECWHLATLPQSFNGLTMVPPGTLHPFLDTLVAIANSGAWYKVAVSNGQAQLTQIGQYGSGYSSSGDAFSIMGVGTFGSVDWTGAPASDVIVSVDPLTGAVQSQVGPVTGYHSLYGLAGWSGEVYGFDASGAVVQIDIANGNTSLIAQTANPWWGAGVSTRIFN
jgi:hypothetical protein